MFYADTEPQDIAVFGTSQGKKEFKYEEDAFTQVSIFGKVAKIL